MQYELVFRVFSIGYSLAVNLAYSTELDFHAGKTAYSEFPSIGRLRIELASVGLSVHIADFLGSRGKVEVTKKQLKQLGFTEFP